MKWAASSVSSPGNAASANIGSAGGGAARVCEVIEVMVAASDAGQPPVVVLLTDGNNNLLWSAVLQAAAGETDRVTTPPVALEGSVNVGLSLAFQSPPAQGATQTASMSGVDA